VTRSTEVSVSPTPGGGKGDRVRTGPDGGRNLAVECLLGGEGVGEGGGQIHYPRKVAQTTGEDSATWEKALFSTLGLGRVGGMGNLKSEGLMMLKKKLKDWPLPYDFCCRTP